MNFSRAERSVGISGFSFLRQFDLGFLFGVSNYSATIGELGGLISIGWSAGYQRRLLSSLSSRSIFFLQAGAAKRHQTTPDPG